MKKTILSTVNSRPQEAEFTCDSAMNRPELQPLFSDVNQSTSTIFQRSFQFITISLALVAIISNIFTFSMAFNIKRKIDNDHDLLFATVFKMSRLEKQVSVFLYSM